MKSKDHEQNAGGLNLPSILTFERKLEVSDGSMLAGSWDKVDAVDCAPDTWTPIIISTRTGRGTKSHYLGDKDNEKVEPNIFEGDSAYLPQGKDTLKVSFTLRVVGNLSKPFSCNSPDFEKLISKKVETFLESEGLRDLAKRYAHNIANGRFLWRNRVGAEKIQVNVRSSGIDDMKFDSTRFDLNDFETNNGDDNLNRLAELIRLGFKNTDKFILLEVDGYVKLGNNQQVFPSQEMNINEKKKSLFKLSGDQAAIHSVKIGNAIRTIDTWYGDEILVLTGEKSPATKVIKNDEETRSPIAIEPYGAVTHRGAAYRYKTNDLYTLLPKWANGDNIAPEQEKYIIANLVRGGLFNNESSKNKE